MKIREVNENKKQFIALLLLADEQENMVDRYLEKGTMYVLEDGDVKAECVVTDEGNEILEIKNIAVNPQNQGKGYGKALQMKVISHIQNRPQKSKAEIDAISLFWSEKDIKMDGAKSSYCICSLQNST